MNRRGLSLLEALFGMFISFMVLGAVTFVLQQTVATGGTLDEQGLVAESSHAFSLLRRDLAAAFSVTEPADTTPLTRITLQMIDPDLAFEARVADGNPFAPAEQVQVRWQWDAGLLSRLVTRAGVTDSQRVLVCAGFDAVREQNLVKVNLVLQQRRVSKHFQLECRLR